MGSPIFSKRNCPSCKLNGNRENFIHWCKRSFGAEANLASAFQSIFGKKTGGILGAIAQIGFTVAGAFAKGGTTPPLKLPGFARGGSLKIAGMSGVDKNLLSINGSPVARVSHGEYVDIRNSSSRNGAPVHFDLRGAVMTADILAQINQMGATATTRGAMYGAGGAQMAMQRSAQRRIP